jgi:geranylgeranyl pyrophosphate synthase
VDSFQEFIERGRARIDRALEAFLPAPPACPSLISEAMRYSVMAGGKRVRPLLALAAADAVARHSDEAHQLAIPAACAVEFIHTYSLVHDDLPAMDNDTLRRGRPTLHVVYGDGIAILAGDALQAEAFALVAREPITERPELAGRKLMALDVLADAAGARGMVGGQVIDLQAAGQAPGHPLTLDAPRLQDMHLRKTGALIRASAMCGAIMAGANALATDAIFRWGTQVGLAFQIVDDVLDVEGNAEALGKTAGKDAAYDKPTYPALFGLQQAKTMAAECSQRAQGILIEAGLADGWLGDMASWVITRRN